MISQKIFNFLKGGFPQGGGRCMKTVNQPLSQILFPHASVSQVDMQHIQSEGGQDDPASGLFELL